MNLNPNSVPRLAIVIPCYNETEVFPFCLREMGEYLNDMIRRNLVQAESYILFVDDGSRDDTWQQISAAAKEHSFVHGLKLSCNKGHQAALLAGLANATQADAIVSIDADLQDDIHAIGKMVQSYMAGHEVVYGVRASRQTDTAFKRTTAELFYRMMTFMGVKQVFNHADFRLLSQRACAALLEYHERNIYIRGLVPLVGFPAEEVYYDRKERMAGVSKYPLRKMLALAMEGITSMTVSPLRLITFVGAAIGAISVLLFLGVMLYWILKGCVSGWTFVIVALFAATGIQMLSLGIVGEYVGKIYLETKERPRYHIEEKEGFPAGNPFAPA